MKNNWWKEGIIYQIYPRSFCDLNQDGVGDLQGIISKLDYLKNLGVDIIWLSPIYNSPNDDNGYDISDYRNIMEEFGTMKDFDVLLSEVHKRDMRLLMDLVVNHSSDEHEWFQQSRSSQDNPYRDYYYWSKGEKESPPTNWKSFFGGSAWEWDETTQAYYLHLFSKKQPDLNWENPKLRQEVYSLMRFWLDKGVDGFRMDVFSLFSKRLPFEDADFSDFTQAIKEVYANGPRIHEFLSEMYEEVFSNYDMVSVGEGVGIDKHKVMDYVSSERKEIDMIYHFDHMFIDHGHGGRFDPKPWTTETFFEIFFAWDATLQSTGWGSIYLGNHDFPRMVSRFGDDGPFWQESAKLLAILIMTLRGTPTIYQGDEIGMKNVPFEKFEEYRDIEFINAYREAKEKGEDMHHFLEIANNQARDHARTPMQWNSKPNGGFSQVEPWIRPHPAFSDINVEKQVNESDSVLSFYKSVITLRKSHLALVYGEQIRLSTGNPTILGFERSWEGKTLRIVLNFSSLEQNHKLEESNWQPIFGNNYPKHEPLEGKLRPWEGIVWIKE
ncbi:MAG: alpha-glucosidase [Bacteroidota bacterium]